MLGAFEDLLGKAHVLTGPDMAAYRQDWTGSYHWEPLAVLRPASTDEVAGCLKLAAQHGLSVVPCGGRTGLVGGTSAEGAVMLSLERMRQIRALKRDARIVIADAGVILSQIHEAAEAEGLYFPLWFGARGSATLGGALSTNAGGSNVLRYGSTRALCLGLEVVLADGRILNLLQELHKDNTGYALKDLFIGAEGTLGVITGAVMKLVPAARLHATACFAADSLGSALAILNRLQAESGGLVEAYEFMPASYMARLHSYRPDLGLPFETPYEVNILVELGSAAPRDAVTDAAGETPLGSLLESLLADEIETGRVLDAVIAKSETQRRRLWERREAAAEITLGRGVLVDTDIALPLERIEEFLGQIRAALGQIDPEAQDLIVAHLGDGNLHYTVFPSHSEPAHLTAIRARIDSTCVACGGSFSAEHGVGLSKRASMAALKDPVALAVMQSLKAALDPEGRLNPGKTLPAPLLEGLAQIPPLA